ncbi:hypothetical protein ACFVT2_00835 [Streptomyces sp. NPDC058000]|uniref:hypothetical protein n=1 Tax=Streptomyces sp. NPDC058000 TaxID=3346299 RepID=UPI0036ECE71E
MIYVEGDFQADGALRDVCILNAELRDWQNVFDHFSASGWSLWFSCELMGLEGSRLPDAASLFAALESDPDESATLAVQVGGIWFTCYFFDAAEIEFTFDPGDVVNSRTFTRVSTFMKGLGDSTGKRVIMTMEGTSHADMPALLEYMPGPV